MKKGFLNIQNVAGRYQTTAARIQNFNKELQKPVGTNQALMQCAQAMNFLHQVTNE